MRRVDAIVLACAAALGCTLGVGAAQALPMAAAPGSAGLTPIPVEYYCSEGFAPTSGGRCVATASRDEIELYVNDPAVVDGVEGRPHRRHHRHGLRERY